MANERLRSAMARAGLSYDDVSERIDVDPKTVERWVTQGRTPYRNTRLKLASLLSEDEVLLWPETESEGRTVAASQAEFVQLYPSRGAVPLAVWSTLIDQATEAIDLLAFAASFLHDAIPDFDESLLRKAESGVAVRLLFGDPESEAVRIRGEEEGIDNSLAERCRLTWKYFGPLVGKQGVESRMHGSTLYSSMFRFDDTLLVNAHVLGAAASQSPVFHLQRIPGGRLFRHYMAGFERTWDGANPAPM